MRQPRKAAERLRTAIEMLPRHTREAMLDGLRDENIIVGAYTDGSGGVCPMLAAHRRGGRTNFAAFARAWDRFARTRRPRPASARELRMLQVHLESSLLRDEQEDKSLVELSAELRASRSEIRSRTAPAERPDTGERDRTRELSRRRGWAWLRPQRRYDRFLEALAAAEEQVSEQRAAEIAREPVSTR
jgi:hypothetical protein